MKETKNFQHTLILLAGKTQSFIFPGMFLAINDMKVQQFHQKMNGEIQ